MSHTIKTAISLPREDFRRIESFRKGAKKSRSQVIQEAVRHWFRKHSQKETEARYARGYARFPEESKTNDEIKALFRAGLAGWEKEEW